VVAPLSTRLPLVSRAFEMPCACVAALDPNSQKTVVSSFQLGMSSVRIAKLQMGDSRFVLNAVARLREQFLAADAVGWYLERLAMSAF
jgi:hypothetical protein